MLLILGLVVLSALFYLYVLKPYNYWQIRGVKYDKPVIFFGCMWEFMLQRMALFLKIDEIYKKFEGERYCGIFQFQKPLLLVRDPELIKEICIKQFDSFAQHDDITDEGVDPYWGKNLFSSTGEQWHSMRSVLSPSFTGSKLKIMFNLISECTEDVLKHFAEQNKDSLTIEMKDTFSRLSNDIIATCAMGVNCNSIKNRDNDVYKHALAITDFHGIKALKFLGYNISPAIMKYFKIKIIPTSSGNFFSELIKETLNLRSEKNIVRPDMIHLMLKAREGLKQDSLQPSENQEYNIDKLKIKKNFQITDEDMTAQALIFLLGGLETVSSLLSFLTYELAINTNIQDKLFTELNKALKNCDGKLDYEGLMGMKYLDMVVNEGLRRWPTMPLITRLCTKDFLISAKNPNEKPVMVEKGTAVWFAPYSLHMDKKYYSDPKCFDPERFSDENKSKIVANTYLPFGIGPRNCIGSRFSLLEVKIVLVEILKTFEIVPVKSTIIPAKISNNDVMMSTGSDIMLGLKKRNWF